MEQYRSEYHRRSIRLKSYDYSTAGAYFVTICTHEKQYFFGEVSGDNMLLTDIGDIALTQWLQIPLEFKGVEIDAFTVMPNHIHGIIVLDDQPPSPGLTQNRDRGLMNQTPTEDGWILMRQPGQNLGKIIRSYKARTSKLLHDIGHSKFQWQRNYYEHVIRNESDLDRIREYIVYNHLKWDSDEENPTRMDKQGDRVSRAGRA